MIAPRLFPQRPSIQSDVLGGDGLFPAISHRGEPWSSAFAIFYKKTKNDYLSTMRLEKHLIMRTGKNAMSAIKEQKSPAENRKIGISGLKAAFNILEKWGV